MLNALIDKAAPRPKAEARPAAAQRQDRDAAAPFQQFSMARSTIHFMIREERPLSRLRRSDRPALVQITLASANHSDVAQP